MKKTFISVMMILLSCFSYAFADSAEIFYVKGKVEAYRNDGWVQLKAGDKILTSETISTGFQSEAKVKFNGSIMALGALTRITLDEFAQTDEKTSVSVYLNTGAVRSKVEHLDSRKTSYTVKSPVAVASVRGTDFVVTSAGGISCSEGVVTVYPNTEPRRTAAGGSPAKAAEEATSDEAPADEAPAGSVAVSASQQTEINVFGQAEKPAETAAKRRDRYVNAGNSLADKETVIVGNPAYTQDFDQTQTDSLANSSAYYAQLVIKVKIPE